MASTEFYVAWALSAVALILFAGLAGKQSTIGGMSSYLGILIDARQRYSLNRFQVVIWTLLVLSTFLGLLFSEVVGNGDFVKVTTIPQPLLILMEISVWGSDPNGTTGLCIRT